MKPALLAGLVLAVVCLGWTQIAKAQGLQINDIKAPQLILWESPEGKTALDKIKKSVASQHLPIPVIGVSKNLMLQITVGDKTGWVFGHHVKTNKKVTLSAACGENAIKGEAGATRGLGEGCNQ